MRAAMLVIASLLSVPARATLVHADDKSRPKMTASRELASDSRTLGGTRPPDKPDANADYEASEANLESNAPRSGMMFAFAGGFGVLMGGDIGVGRGGAASFRVGHRATHDTELTFELSGTGALHKIGMNDPATTDTNAGLFVGAQTYFGRATWLRLAGGPTVFTANVKTSMQRTAGGVGGLVGAGLDLARWGYLVLGFETFAMSSLTTDGFKMQLGFAFGLSYY